MNLQDIDFCKESGDFLFSICWYSNPFTGDDHVFERVCLHHLQSRQFFCKFPTADYDLGFTGIRHCRVRGNELGNLPGHILISATLFKRTHFSFGGASDGDNRRTCGDHCLLAQSHTLYTTFTSQSTNISSNCKI
jgi:hypothetical protein